jgi:hypothetical protein
VRLQVLTAASDTDGCVRFQVLTAASTKFKVIWDVAPCSHVVVDRRFRSHDGGSTYLCNVGQLQRDSTALYPTRLYKLR